MNKKIIFAVLLLGLILAGAAYFSYSPTPAEAQGTGPVELTGWAWSSNIGWVSMNCSNTEANDACSTYGVTVNPASADGTQNLTGWAWSSNIGWINFRPTIGGSNSGDTLPTNNPNNAGVPAQINSTGTALEGWARACSVFLSGCAGTLKPAEARGGWDGWISLKGSNYGVNRITSTDGTTTYSGYGWGSLVTGWLDFTAGSRNGGGGCDTDDDGDCDCDDDGYDGTCGGGGDSLSVVCRAEPDAVDVRESVSWIADASNASGNVTYNWVITPGGQTGTGERFDVPNGYSIPGTYEATVTATDSRDSKIGRCSVTVNSGTCPTTFEDCVDGNGIVTSDPTGHADPDVWPPICTPDETAAGTTIIQSCRPRPPVICPPVNDRRWTCNPTTITVDYSDNDALRVMNHFSGGLGYSSNWASIQGTPDPVSPLLLHFKDIISQSGNPICTPSRKAEVEEKLADYPDLFQCAFSSTTSFEEDDWKTCIGDIGSGSASHDLSVDNPVNLRIRFSDISNIFSDQPSTRRRLMACNPYVLIISDEAESVEAPIRIEYVPNGVTQG